MNLILSNIGYIYLVLYGITLVPSLMLKNRTSCTMIVALSFFEMAAWNPAIWLDSMHLLLTHITIFSCLYLTHVLYGSLNGRFGDRVLLMGGLMVITDAIFYVSGWPRFFHHSTINLLFLILLYFTFRAAYNSLKLQGMIREDGNGVFYPKVEEDVLCMPLRW